MTTDDAVKKVAQGAGVTFVGKLISTGFKYATQLLIARLLGAEAFGIYALGIVLYQFGELVSRLGLEAGAVRYVAVHFDADDRSKLKGVLVQTLGLPLILGAMFGTILYVAADSIALTIFDEPDLAEVLRVMAIAVPFGASMMVAAFATTGFHLTKYKVYLLELILPCTTLIFSVVACLLGWQIVGVAIAWLLATLISFLSSLWFIYRLFPDLFKRTVKPTYETRQLLIFSLSLVLGNFLWLVLLWTDVLMLGYFRPAAEVGVYRAASQTSFLMTIVATSLNTMFAPVIASLFSRGDRDKMNELFQTTTRWSFALSLPLFLIVAVVPQELLSLFGEEFQVGALALVILSLGQLVRAGTGPGVDMLVMSGNERLKVVGDIAAVLMNAVLNLLLIPPLGVGGAAIASAISISAVNLLRLVQVYTVLQVQAFNWGYFKPVAAGAAAGIAGFLIHIVLAASPWLVTLLITAAVILLVYAALLLVLGIDPSDRVLLQKMLRKVGL